LTASVLPAILSEYMEAMSCSTLTPRERVRLTLGFQQADRVPIDLDGWATYFTEGAYRNLLQHLGIEEKPKVNDWFLISGVNESILQRFGVDFRRIGLGVPDRFRSKTLPDGSWDDEWGVRKRKVAHYNPRTGQRAYYAEMIEPPLAEASIDDLESYPWPDPEDPGRYRGLSEQVKRLYHTTDYALVAASIGNGIFEQAQALRGMQRFLEDLLINREFAASLIGRILQIQLRIFDRYLAIVGPYVEMVETSDDYGMQTGPLVSPKLYRDMLKPAHLRLNSFIKQRTRAKIYLHSCGSIAEVLDELIDAGIDVINPVQPRAKDMDSAGLKSRFAGRVVFHGGVDEQYVLPHGSIEEVRKEVARCIRAFAPGGGYIFAPAHNIQDDVPPDNVVTMFETALQLGHYPVSAAESWA
jgi:uroporphyrinogen decarboxylase